MACRLATISVGAYHVCATRTDGTANVFVTMPHHTAYVSPAETIETVNESLKDGLNRCPKCGSTDVSLRGSTGMLVCHFCRNEWQEARVEEEFGLEYEVLDRVQLRQLEPSLDASLIGGLRVKVGSRMIDGSYTATLVRPKTKGSYKIVTQYSMGPIEEIGLLKMDFLGLRNLDVIEDAVDIIKRSRGVELHEADDGYCPEMAGAYYFGGEGNTGCHTFLARRR